MDKEEIGHINNDILLGHDKEWHLNHLQHMDGPIGYYTKWSKSDKDKYDVISIMCVISKTNEQMKQKQTHRYREQIDGFQMGGGWGAGWMDEGI